MRHKGGIALLRRAMPTCLGIALILSLFTATSPQRDAAAAQYAQGSSDAATVSQPPTTHEKPQNETAPAYPAAAGINPSAGMTVVIMNDAGQFPLAIKVGDQYIELPGPSSWPQGADDGKAGSTNGRFLAVLIDTADILKANGFRPDAPFSFVINGTEMNANNTHRILVGEAMNTAATGHQGRSRDDGTLATAGSSWRAFSFQNIVVSHGQIPALSDYLVAPRNLAMQGAANGGAQAQAPAASSPQYSRFAPTGYHGDAPQVEPLEEPSPVTNQKYIKALNSPDPAVRADAIENLILNGYREADVTQSAAHPDTAATPDNNSTTNDKYLDSADQLDESLPQETLSGIALHDKNPAVRVQALDQLVERFGQQASPTLKEAMHDPDPRVARMAGALMSDMGNTDQ